MTMSTGVTVICDTCGKDASDNPAYRGFRRTSYPSLEHVLQEDGWLVTAKYGPYYELIAQHTCPVCKGNKNE
jgi:hypothetical protein